MPGRGGGVQCRASRDAAALGRPCARREQLLDERDMSQAELARRIGLDQNKLNKSLTGKRRITVAEMEAIRVALGTAQPIARIGPCCCRLSMHSPRATP